MLLIVPDFGDYLAWVGASCADMACGNAMQPAESSRRYRSRAPSAAAPVARGRRPLVLLEDFGFL
jgi:hypothetical protein